MSRVSASCRWSMHSFKPFVFAGASKVRTSTLAHKRVPTLAPSHFYAVLPLYFAFLQFGTQACLLSTRSWCFGRVCVFILLRIPSATSGVDYALDVHVQSVFYNRPVFCRLFTIATSSFAPPVALEVAKAEARFHCRPLNVCSVTILAPLFSNLGRWARS